MLHSFDAGWVESKVDWVDFLTTYMTRLLTFVSALKVFCNKIEPRNVFRESAINYSFGQRQTCDT